MGCFDKKPQTMPDGTPVTPLPKKKILALVICSMTWGFQMNIIFPFMPFMVPWMRGTEEDNGFCESRALIRSPAVDIHRHRTERQSPHTAADPP